MPNIIAYLALLSWPFACWIFFRQFEMQRAILWSIIAGYLVLPPVANLNLPLVPSLDKDSIPTLLAFLFCILAGTKFREFFPKGVFLRLLITLFIVSSIPTVLTNSDPVLFSAIAHVEPIQITAWGLPALSIRDVISMLSGQFIALVPFLLAYRYLSDDKGMRLVLVFFVVSMLIYSAPSLLEIRFSPQINIWIYGFFQHDFVQTMRGGGFRPIVFLQHPLWLALFVVYGVVAAAALTRIKSDVSRTKWLVALIYLGLLLVLCKSMASLIYAMLLVPLVFVTGPRSYVRVAFVMALIATIYPLLRGTGNVPVDAFMAWSNSINPERAASLGYRIFNEDQLLERAWEKPLLGWGGWGRNLLYDVHSGEILTIPDGRWIVTFGTYGWLGYVCEFGLLAAPILLLFRESFGANGKKISIPAATLALLLGMNMIDMLLNATLTPITWMLSGATLGYVQALRRARRASAVQRLQSVPAIGALQSEDGPRTAF